MLWGRVSLLPVCCHAPSQMSMSLQAGIVEVLSWGGSVPSATYTSLQHFSCVEEATEEDNEDVITSGKLMWTGQQVHGQAWCYQRCSPCGSRWLRTKSLTTSQVTMNLLICQTMGNGLLANSHQASHWR